MEMPDRMTIRCVLDKFRKDQIQRWAVGEIASNTLQLHVAIIRWDELKTHSRNYGWSVLLPRDCRQVPTCVEVG
jgi:hypothetical protein